MSLFAGPGDMNSARLHSEESTGLLSTQVGAIKEDLRTVNMDGSKSFLCLIISAVLCLGL